MKRRTCIGQCWTSLLPPLVIALFLLGGCTDNPHDVDISGSEVTVELRRLDEDLFSLQPNAVEAAIPNLVKKYGEFFEDYTAGVLRIGRPDNPAFAYSLSQFISDESMRSLYDDSRTDFADVSDIHQELNLAFSYFHYHFPDSSVPNVVMNISGLNYAVIATRSTLGIGTDMFLGAEHPVYPLVGLPQYMFRNMKRDQMVPQAMTGWLQSMYEESAARSTMLDHMIFHGKILYALDAVLVHWEDSAKIGYLSEEMEWCSENEAAVWAHLVEHDMLYSTDHMLINKWIEQAPFISGIPKNSPGRLGRWVGWGIVREFMRRNPEVTLSELMAMESAQQVLSRSRYKPSK